MRKPSPAILMYHRVADLRCDPWGLAVTPERFAEQMRALSALRLPISMEEFVVRLDCGTLPRHAIAVTFDDGYIDNLIQAKPILEEAAVPATIFLVTGQLGCKVEFWWDELARLVFGRRAAIEGMLRIEEQTISMQLQPIASGTSIRTHWRAWEPPETEREQLYHKIWHLLRDLGRVSRERHMQFIRELLDDGQPDPASLAMTRKDVAQLISGSRIQIGAHSQTHPALTRLSPDEQRQEIFGSRADCEMLIGQPIRGFAYPHGDRDAATMKMVTTCGLDWACSTRAAAINPVRFDRFDLPRLQALNWDAEGLQRELQNLQYDP